MDKLDPEMVERFRNMMAGGRIPKFPTKCFYDKEFLLNMHDNCIGAHDNKLAEDGRTLQQTSTPTQHSSAKVKLVPANQITIATLIKSVDKVLHGKFLLCRVIAPAFKMTALSMIVDDPPGIMAVRLSLYNFTDDVGYLTLADSVGILPVGTVLAIKNPWLKTTMDGGLSVRCDNPDEVVVMSETALMQLNPELKWGGYIPGRYTKYMRNRPKDDDDNDWKRYGNEQFVAKRFLEAIEAYTNGLKSEPGNPDLLANRAAAYLNIENFELAVADTDQVLNSDPKHLKAIFRKTKALWGLQKYEEAQQFLKNKVLAIPTVHDDRLIQGLWSKTELMISQSKYGQYPMMEIATKDYSPNAKCTQIGTCLDWADFQGPVSVKPTNDARGRGTFATHSICAGQLILASKAFGFVKKDKGHKLLFSANMDTKLISDASQVQLVSSIAHRLRNNPERGKTLYTLYAGPELGSLNPETDDCSTVDIKRIDSICTYNAFGYGSALDFDDDRFTGLWILPSLINHNCIDCNCCWTVYGDFILVRAFKDIEAGEEITIAYTSPSETFEGRTKLFSKYGFECRCHLCEYDRQEPEALAKEKDDLLQQIAKLEKETRDQERFFTEVSVDALLPMIDRLNQIRPKYNLFMPQILDNLAGYCLVTRDFLNAAKYLEQSFQILENTPLRVNAFRTTLHLVAAYAHSDRRSKAKRWFNELKNVAVCCWGKVEVINKFAPPQMLEELKKIGIHTNEA